MPFAGIILSMSIYTILIFNSIVILTGKTSNHFWSLILRLLRQTAKRNWIIQISFTYSSLVRYASTHPLQKFKLTFLVDDSGWGHVWVTWVFRFLVSQNFTTLEWTNRPHKVNNSLKSLIQLKTTHIIAPILWHFSLTYLQLQL